MTADGATRLLVLITPLLPAALAASLFLPSAGAGDGPRGNAKADLDGFRKEVAPFLQQHCANKTLRERMEVNKQAYCWQCHRKMNPLGLAFEGYDYLGRFRTAETVADPTKPPAKPAKKGEVPVPATRDVPVDTRGAVAHTGDPALDGDVKDAAELVHRLAGSERVRQVFVRHAFRYWMGRNETPADAPTLLAADKAYAESGGSMKALVTALLTSDSFLYRR